MSAKTFLIQDILNSRPASDNGPAPTENKSDINGQETAPGGHYQASFSGRRPFSSASKAFLGHGSLNRRRVYDDAEAAPTEAMWDKAKQHEHSVPSGHFHRANNRFQVGHSNAKGMFDQANRENRNINNYYGPAPVDRESRNGTSYYGPAPTEDAMPNEYREEPPFEGNRQASFCDLQVTDSSFASSAKAFLVRANLKRSRDNDAGARSDIHWQDRSHAASTVTSAKDMLVQSNLKRRRINDDTPALAEEARSDFSKRWEPPSEGRQPSGPVKHIDSLAPPNASPEGYKSPSVKPPTVSVKNIPYCIDFDNATLLVSSYIAEFVTSKMSEPVYCKLSKVDNRLYAHVMSHDRVLISLSLMPQWENFRGNGFLRFWDTTLTDPARFVRDIRAFMRENPFEYTSGNGRTKTARLFFSFDANQKKERSLATAKQTRKETVASIGARLRALVEKCGGKMHIKMWKDRKIMNSAGKTRQVRPAEAAYAGCLYWNDETNTFSLPPRGY